MAAPSGPIPAPSSAEPSAAAAIEWQRKPKTIDANLKDYAAAAKTFTWKDVEREFDWSRTGKVNVVHEAVDRHAASWRKNKVALYYTDFERRDEKYTFQELKGLTSRFAHVLKALGVSRGDRVGVFLPRTPELYIVILGINRVGAIPVPLFEAFMEQAIEDRLGDSEAVVCVTSPILKVRIPLAKLPALKRLILIGPQTVLAFAEEIRRARTVLWNGPMGVFENPLFAAGTAAVAHALAACNALTVIGGGDSASAVEQLNLADKMTHISTGGGASLEFLEGRELPGVAALMDSPGETAEKDSPPAALCSQPGPPGPRS